MAPSLAPAQLAFRGFLVRFGIIWIFFVGRQILSESSDPFTAFRTGQYSIVEGE
jgi:hypothetical protein